MAIETEKAVFLGLSSSRTRCKISKPVKTGKKSRSGISVSVIPFWLEVRLSDQDSVSFLRPACVQAVCVWRNARKSKVSDCQRHEILVRLKELAFLSVHVVIGLDTSADMVSSFLFHPAWRVSK